MLVGMFSTEQPARLLASHVKLTPARKMFIISFISLLSKPLLTINDNEDNTVRNEENIHVEMEIRSSASANGYLE